MTTMSTSTDHLLRDLAPIPARAWQQIDGEARERLTPRLGGRRLADWVGTGGWRHDALSIGRTTELDGPPGAAIPGVRTRLRRLQPLAEFRVPFTVARAEVEDLQRGSSDPELDDLNRAAQASAEIENRIVFHGWPAAGITGITEASPYETKSLGSDPEKYPNAVARAVDELRCNGIAGPYALAIGPEGYTRIVETTEHGGYLLLEHLTRIMDGQVVWAPGVEGAVVVSARGGDFLLDVGQDLSVGYMGYDAENVQLYLEESLTFRVAEPDAGIALS
jgi:uncharacterized linocin/CFP29 family protein